MALEPLETSAEEWLRHFDPAREPMTKAMNTAGAVAITPLDSTFGLSTPGSGGMGPGEPMAPIQRAESAPRVFDYPVGYNFQTRPRAYEATSFALLRALSENYDVARIAIETRIAEIRALDWAIIPKSISGQGRKQARVRRESLKDEIERAERFFLHPDGVSDFGTWVGEWLDDTLSIDAPTLYPRLTLDGGIHALEIVDGATIRPIIDVWGRPPAPPDPAYGQVIKGMSWGLYTREELLYTPYRKRSKSPYGYPPLEWVLLTVNRALRRQSLDLSMYTEGTMPSAFYRMPEGWSGTQLKELQDILDQILAGNDAFRARVRLMPGGTGTGLERINPEPKNDVEEWLMTVTAAAYGTNPTELGFQPRGIGLGGKGFQEAQEAINYRKNLRPLGRHMKYVFDHITDKHFNTELEWQWTGLIEEADQLKQAQTDEIYWRIGVYSGDFIAQKQDVDPPGLGHIIAYNGNVIPVQQIIDQYGEYGDQSPLDSADTDLSGAKADPVALPKAGKPMDTPNKPSGTDGLGVSSAVAPGTPSRIAKRAMAGDIAAWRRKATNAVRMGKRAAVPFQSEAIPPQIAREISARLEGATDKAAVAAAFVLPEGGAGTDQAPFVQPANGPAESFGPSSVRDSLDKVKRFYSDLGFGNSQATT